MNAAPVVRDVLLVGGGHTHALLVRRWGMRPLPGVRLTLVSDGVLTPYSGMLPGLLAGHYTQREVHIDLLRLCGWAGVRFIDARLTALDPDARTATLDDRPAIGFDLLSLDTGSTPDLSIPGAAEYATPVKPVHQLAARWRELRSRVASAARDAAVEAGASGRGSSSVPGSASGSAADSTLDRPLDIAVVGSGAGGFELLMAVRHALPSGAARLHWILRGELPLAGRHASARRAAARAAMRADIALHTGFDVVRVDAGPVLRADDGRRLALDELLWCTAASGPDWPRESGLATDPRGFVLTEPTLASSSHPAVYATGDIGSRRDAPHAKAGVHAVRQAPVLDHNLRAHVLGEPLRRYRPQRDFLSLMATGPKHAIASRGPFTVQGRWVWRWKDRIDRRFMHRFERLPPMSRRGTSDVLADVLVADWATQERELAVPADPRAPSPGARHMPDSGGVAVADARADASDTNAPIVAHRCHGCGAKVADDLLSAALSRHASSADQDHAGVKLGLAEARDVSSIAIRTGTLVQSVDQLSALFDDPWRFARVASLHALSDLLTVRAAPHSALLTLVMPPAAPRVQRRELQAVLAGVVDTLDEHGMTLVGGHTAEGPQLQIGLTLNAFETEADTGRSVPSDGDAILLTRPIGTGVLFAGAMRSRARGEDVAAALERMSRSQAPVADCLWRHGARSMTDVTGFGLAGHLERWLAGSGLGARLNVHAVPILAGARTLAEAGIRSSLADVNMAALDRMQLAETLDDADRRLLADPQTAGGFLAVLPAERVGACLEALHAPGMAIDACRIGTLASDGGHRIVHGDA